MSVTITIEERELSGGTHLEITLVGDPPLPIATVTDPRHLALLEGDRDLDVDNASQEQLAARLALEHLCGSAEAALVCVRSERPDL